ncbi:MAG TPA: hypothetical protein VEA59_01665 [Patescibacteria group bacterium]|nr:hypothetical protein [Patescibacteria group bacterium]
MKKVFMIAFDSKTLEFFEQTLSPAFFDLGWAVTLEKPGPNGFDFEQKRLYHCVQAADLVIVPVESPGAVHEYEVLTAALARAYRKLLALYLAEPDSVKSIGSRKAKFSGAYSMAASFCFGVPQQDTVRYKECFPSHIEFVIVQPRQWVSIGPTLARMLDNLITIFLKES